MSETDQTRARIIQAFNRLVLNARRDRPSVASLLREAGIARSTLYRHFDDRDSLLIEAMRGPLSIFASALLSPEGAEKLPGLLQHFKENRLQAKDILAGPLAIRIIRTLADELSIRGADLSRADLIRIADAQIGLLRLWITGETPCSTTELSEKMIVLAAAQFGALRSRDGSD